MIMNNNLLIDFYELTMSQAYFMQNKHQQIAYFDVFFRRIPDSGSFVIANGIGQIVEYLQNFAFTSEDINYLKSLGKFNDGFLEYLKKVKFTGDMWAVEDGTIVFENEPVITIKAPLIEAQLIETMLLLLFNRSSLITTKAARIVLSAKGKAVMEFGTRRAQGISAAVDGARDTFVAGCVGTACTQAGFEYGLPVLGTMAHSFVQSFDTEFEAFKAYALAFPTACTLLVDTYNTLKKGVPNAIRVHNEVLAPMGQSLKGIRIDSGDLAYLSKQARKMLDEAGLIDTQIIVSNSLDEFLISSLLEQDSPIDVFGVGENMITAKSQPVFGGVYKLVALEEDGKIIPKIKLSDNESKTTNPHFKKIFRLYDKEGMFITDIISLHNEDAPKGQIELVHSTNDWVRKTVDDYVVTQPKVKMFENGKQIFETKTLQETKAKVQAELATLWPEAKRLYNPHTYTINLSEQLKQIKNELIKNNI
jgi:nicotinate phosphoribosyltransferase